jgi:hypothetical protein
MGESVSIPTALEGGVVVGLNGCLYKRNLLQKVAFIFYYPESADVLPAESGRCDAAIRGTPQFFSTFCLNLIVSAVTIFR